jgi:hypothetical protein
MVRALVYTKIVEPSPESKSVGAPAKIRPNQRVDVSVLDRLLCTNQACRELIDKACFKNVNRIRFRNPFFQMLRCTVGTGLQIIASHERRHLLQAQRVRESLSFPKKKVSRGLNS